jgi:hypothetical protein
MESIRRVRIDNLLLVLFALGYVFVQSKDGIFVPEEPGFLDFRWIFRVLDSKNTSWEQAGLADQINLIWPWGILSALLYSMGLGVSGHFIALLFVRVITLLLAMKYVMARRASPFFATCCTLIAFTLTPLRVAPFYTHWWSHVVLFCIILLFLQRNQIRMRDSVLFLCLVSLTLGVWTNVPHLITSLIGIPAAVVFALVTNEVSRRDMLKRVLLSTFLIMLIWIAPALWFLSNLDQLSGIDPLLMSHFSNAGWWKVVQGFAGWWYFRKVCWESVCIPYDNVNFALVNNYLVIARTVLMTSIAFALAYSFRTTNGIARRKHQKVTVAFLSLCIPLFFLTLMGNYQIYFDLRAKIPSVLGMFREPYPKFGPAFYVVVWSFVAFSLSTMREVLSKTKLLPLLVLVITLALIAPLARSTNRPVLMSHSEWSTFADDARRFNELPDDVCVFDRSKNRDVLTYLQLNYPSKFTNMENLRGFWRNDALALVGKTVDRPNTCLRNTTDPIVVIETVDGPSFLEDQRIVFESQSRKFDSLQCQRESFQYFTIVAGSCYFILQVKSNSEQSSAVYIDRFNERSEVSSTLFNKVLPKGGIRLFYESFEHGKLNAVIVIKYSDSLEPSSPVFETRLNLRSGVETEIKSSDFLFPEPLIKSAFIFQS